MQCPDCGLLNPPSTIRCDCGHVFPQDPGNDAPTDPSSRLSDLESRLVQQEREFQRLGEQLREMRREVLLLKTGRAGAPASNEIPSPNQAEQQRSTVPSDPDPRSPEFRTLSERPNRFHFGERPPSWMATREWEAMIGGSWLAKIGIFALVLGVLYFLKYAFDNEWIGNAGRVLIGAVSGVELLRSSKGSALPGSGSRGDPPGRFQSPVHVAQEQQSAHTLPALGNLLDPRCHRRDRVAISAHPVVWHRGVCRRHWESIPPRHLVVTADLQDHLHDCPGKPPSGRRVSLPTPG